MINLSNRNQLVVNENKNKLMERKNNPFACTKNIFCSFTKLRPFLRVLNGWNVGRVEGFLNASRNVKFAGIIRKTLNSAVANAVNLHGLQKNDLVISEAFANKGKTAKRIEYRARMGTNFRRKHICNLFIYLNVSKKNVEQIIEEKKGE